MSQIKVLITGTNGQLGSELRAICLNSEHISFFFIGRMEMDLEETEQIQPILETYKPQYIVHTAAYTDVDAAEDHPEKADKINHLASLEIAKYCRQNQCKLLYISTDYVFKGDLATPLEENHPTHPINTYGETKLKGELAILNAFPEAIIIRTSWVYSGFGKNFVKTMVNAMRNNSQVRVVNDQIGSPTYAGDLAEVIKQILTLGYWEPGIYHYSNKGQASWYDFAVAIREFNSMECEIIPIPSSEYPTSARRPAYSLLNKNKIRNTFSVDVPNWQDSLRKMLVRLNY